MQKIVHAFLFILLDVQLFSQSEKLFEFNIFVNMNVFFWPTSLAKPVIIST